MGRVMLLAFLAVAGLFTATTLKRRRKVNLVEIPRNVND